MTVYLVDTPVLLWAMLDDPKLSDRHREILAGPERCLVSVASIWEMSIKEGLGRLDVPSNLLDLIARVGIETLQISPVHAWHARVLPTITAIPSTGCWPRRRWWTSWFC